MSNFDKGGILGGWVSGRLETWECVINRANECIRTDKFHDPWNTPGVRALGWKCDRYNEGKPE